ncbi:MAG: preprotein translocase subunit YajC [Clostridia bacterium]|nr:preprotein translocase subunit YajC [Clostridia bacterium]
MQNIDSGTGQAIQLILSVVILVAAFYFVLIRPQSKQQKEEEQMRRDLEIGDEITTIGGIVGRVVNINDNDNSMIIETGADRTKIKFTKNALASINKGKSSDKKDGKKESSKKESK